MSREIMQQSLKLLIAYQDCTMDSYITNKCGLTIQALKQELAKPEQTDWRAGFDAGYETAKEQAEFKEIKQAEEQAPKMPTKIFGPNLEQILNAAGFYRRKWVGLTDEERNEMRSIVQGHTKRGAPTYGLTLQYATEEVLKEKNGG